MLRNTVEKILKNTIILGVKLKETSQISKDLAELINSCLEMDPKARRSAEEFLQHPVFATNDITQGEFGDFAKERLITLHNYR